MTVDRDKYTDAGRDGRDQLQLKDVGVILDFRATTVEKELEQNGYDFSDTPTGAKKPAPYLPQLTSGGRGRIDRQGRN